MKIPLILVSLSMAIAVARSETPLEKELLAAVRSAHFQDVIDFGAGNEAHPVKAPLNLPAQKIAHPPNLNVAVIQLDAAGNLVDRAFVLLSRDYPEGLIVPLDKNLTASSVRFRRWDIERSDGGTFSKAGDQLTTKGWTNNPPLTASDDLVPGRESAPIQFMAPYPASLFKLMIAFHIMRMIDAGTITLESDYNYAPAGGKVESRKIRDWIEPMITVSDNHATSALVKMLHDKNEIEPLNREFRALTLATLQINGTNPKNGLNWFPGQIHMTAWDTARLLWLIEGGAPLNKDRNSMWLDADGQPVTTRYLSDASRGYLKKTLLAQGWNEALSTANMTGAPNVRPGIPSRVATRWINATNGHAMVEGTDCGVDIRVANERAAVEFAHKTGLTFNYAADAGIVTARPGQPFRHYVVAFIANLGNRYADEVFAARKTFPAEDPVGPIAYTQKIPALGKAIDDLVTKLSTGLK